MLTITNASSSKHALISNATIVLKIAFNSKKKIQDSEKKFHWFVEHVEANLLM